MGPATPGLNAAANLASVLMEQGRIEATQEVLEARLTAAEAQWPQGHWRVAPAPDGR